MNSPDEQKAAYVREHFANTPPVKTTSGIAIDPVYVPVQDGAAQHAALGVPGAFPFTRGPYPTMYRGKPWTMRQYAGFGDAGETNARFRKLLERGQTGLSVAFDLPTQIGYDPDHEFAEGEVGKVGVSIATLDDLDRLFDGIPLDRVSVSMTINATATILLAFTIALAKRRGVAKDQLRGTVQNDILKEYIARGTYRFPIRPAMRLVTDLIGYCATDCRAGTRSRSPATTCAKRAAPPRRRSRSRSAMAARTSRTCSSAASTSTRSRRSSRSSSTRTTTSSKRSRSSAPRAACGPR
jgi:methylmalonyl-CoA mutase N-terminal domain/subunit